MPISRWNVDLPTAQDLPALPKGVVLHWTGGGPRANAIDLGAYHYIIEVDGGVAAGHWPVAANMRKLADDRYAKHTGGFNSFRVGLSCAGMKDYLAPSSPGVFPLTEVQVKRMAEVAAYFIGLGKLDPRNPLHLCTHQEVWTLHGIKGTQNHTKSDIEFLPFLPELKPKEVGNHLRRLTAEALEAFRTGSGPGAGETSNPAPAASVVLPDPLVVRDAREITPEVVVSAAPAQPVPRTSPVAAEGEERSLWDRVVGRLLG